MNQPKIELHCHLDGSLRTKTVIELAAQAGITLTDHQILDMESLLIAPEDCDSLDTYLKRFELPISIMQSADALERVAYELMEDAFKEGVTYIEIRFAPQLHIRKGLSLEAVINSVVAGIKRAESDFDMKGNVILSYLRNTEPDAFYAVIDAGLNKLKKGVVAVDLCGGERDLFSARFSDVIGYARGLGYEVTIHAGETGIVQNIIEAIDLLGAKRIGHGVAMNGHPEVIQKVIEKGVSIECCPTSNVQTKAIQVIEDHPIHMYKALGVSVSINTDNRTVSNTTMTHELTRMSETFDWTDKDAYELYNMSVHASFASDDVKKWLLHKWVNPS